MKKQISADQKKSIKSFSTAKISNKQLGRIKGGDGTDGEGESIVTEEEIIA